jgi:chromosome segregation protein
MDYIQAPMELRALIARLMAGARVVSELRAEGTGGDWPQVSPGGELLHPDGWLRGGASGVGDGTNAEDTVDLGLAGTGLARERALRELPGEIERLTEAVAAHETDLAQVQGLQRQRREQMATAGRAAQTAEAHAQHLARAVAALQREEERAANDLQLAQTLAEQLAGEVAGLEQEVATSSMRVAEQEAAQQAAQARTQQMQEALDHLLEQTRDQQEEVGQLRTAVAIQRQGARSLAQRAEQSLAQARELEGQLSRRAERAAALSTQRGQLAETIAQQQATLAQLREQTRQLAGALQEQEVALRAAEQELGRIDSDQAQARQELEGLEVEYRHRIVDAQRARDAVDALEAQLREEWGELSETGAPGELSNPLDLLAAPAEGASGGEEERRPRPGTSVARPPQTEAPAEDTARMRRQIDQLRNRLRHLGGYDPDAPQAYEELKTRFEFLSGQVRDMEQASANLRTVIAELDATMRRRFTETFNTVNQRFQQHFTTLFSGGAARLELTAPRRQSQDDDDDEDPIFGVQREGSAPGGAAAQRGLGVGGIEVFVQIPGKRVQDLALLSGGERAMVSAALLFALLETNPPPFCLLDEVDAALDEANVVRFSEILEALADRTQFIVITHNRVTMTHSGAIYGVSMGSDSVSRVLSMRLTDVQAAR